jgi:hypothetical protein
VAGLQEILKDVEKHITRVHVANLGFGGEAVPGTTVLEKHVVKVISQVS